MAVSAVGNGEGGIKEDGLGTTWQLKRDRKKEHLEMFLLKIFFLRLKKSKLSEMWYIQGKLYFWNICA